MKFIVISCEHYAVSCEVESIRSLIRKGIGVHIRKRKDPRRLKEFLSQFSQEERQKMTLHESITIAQEMNLGGIHLKGHQHRDEIPQEWKGRISKSCHSLDEITHMKDTYDYVFLSPIYDSISKENYPARFDLTTLKEEILQIPQKVIALGGVTLNRIGPLEMLGFSGAAFLGGFWQLDSVNERAIFIDQLATDDACS